MTDFGNGTTKVNEIANTVVVEKVQYFKLLYQCTHPGIASPTYVPLQDTGIFLYEIVDPASVTKDVFTRVVDVPDFSEYPNNRNTAIALGSNFWRNSTAALSYTDFSVANAAKTTMHDRIDALCQDFSAYSLQFLTPVGGNTGKYPLDVVADPVVDQLADVYYAAYEDYLESLSGASPGASPSPAGWQSLWDDYQLKNSLVTEKATAKTTAEATYTSLSYAYQYYHDFVKNVSDSSNAYWYYGIVAGHHPTEDAVFAARRTEEDTVHAAKVYADASAANTAAIAAAGAYTTALQNRLTSYTTLQTKHDALSTLRTAVTTAHAAVIAACPAFEDPRGYDITELPALPTMPATP